MKESTMRLVMVCLWALVLPGCASSIATDYDPQASFGTYSTYAFEPGPAGQVQSLDDSRARSALEQAMTKEGLQRMPPDRADLWVRFRFEDERKYESRGFSYGLGIFNRPFGFGISTRPEARVVRQEQLVVELVEPQSNRVIWQGRSREYLTENMGPSRRGEVIRELVNSMLERYPPES